jgi:hypothetical protein
VPTHLATLSERGTLTTARRPLGWRAAAAIVALASVGCGRVEVEGWAVSCEGLELLDAAACASIAGAALNNLGRGRPSEPQGVIAVHERRACPEMPDWADWADPSPCWNVEIPIGGVGRPACLVMARSAQRPGYGQVAGDELSGLATSHSERGCPPDS